MLCPNCGATLPDGSTRCPVCGHYLSAQDGSSSPQSSASPSATAPAPVVYEYRQDAEEQASHGPQEPLKNVSELPPFPHNMGPDYKKVPEALARANTTHVGLIFGIVAIVLSAILAYSIYSILVTIVGQAMSGSLGGYDSFDLITNQEQQYFDNEGYPQGTTTLPESGERTAMGTYYGLAHFDNTGSDVPEDERYDDYFGYVFVLESDGTGTMGLAYSDGTPLTESDLAAVESSMNVVWSEQDGVIYITDAQGEDGVIGSDVLEFEVDGEEGNRELVPSSETDYPVFYESFDEAFEAQDNY
ncbi:MAG: zinc ribbon domain-containing protein [Tractidigestivibacter sp.]|jgi:uncharacterized Zn finger protein (UPF0148 family)|uniref:zinc ribbon domain-containing protein n=1 Tax=Tractidigestivibacter sp. TaxID=2847320 RepID=UPI003D920034